MNPIRIDKWLWAVRLFKTRTQASQSCDENRVSVGSVKAKPSKHIKPGDKIEIKWNGGLIRTIEVLQLTEKRMAAKLVTVFYKELTEQKDIDEYKARVARAAAYRDKGTGRPTKKDRRDMDDFLDAVDDLFT